MKLADVIVADSSLLYVLIWTVFGLVGLFLGMSKNRPGMGLVFGFAFGFIGWIIIGCSKPLEEGEPDSLRLAFLLMIVTVVAGIFLIAREGRRQREAEDQRREIAERNQGIHAAAAETAARATPRPKPGDWMWKRSGNPLDRAPSRY